jgi:DNA-directed RNA polymerase specialized sigma24 family protein
VLQEAAMIALEKLSAFTPGSNLRAWFAQIVTNVARNAAW